MSTTLINLTPHRFTVLRDERPIIDIPPSGLWARILEERLPMSPVTLEDIAIECVALAYRPLIQDLPPPQTDVIYLVSRITAAAVDGRTDVVFPLDEVRDGTGRIIGCRRLGRFDPRIVGGAV